MEALRTLKRRPSDAVYRQLVADARTAQHVLDPAADAMVEHAGRGTGRTRGGDS